MIEPSDIVYQDQSIVVLNKKCGQVMHEAPGHPHETTLAHALTQNFSHLSSINGDKQPGMVHRLDKDTSGLLLIAKNDNAHLEMQLQIKSGHMQRSYFACVARQVKTSGLWEDWIGRSGRQKMKTTTSNPFKRATMTVHTLYSSPAFSLIECHLQTGIQHQIRCQTSSRGHPILGDAIYGRRNKHPLSDKYGMLLHAHKLEFLHPNNNKKMSFQINPPWWNDVYKADTSSVIR